MGSRSSPVLTAAAAGLAMVAITALSLLFANSDQATRIADGSDALLRIGEVQDAVTATRSSVGLALVFAAANEEGVAAPDETAATIADARADLGELTTRVLRAETTTFDPEAVAAAEEVIDLAGRTLDMLESGRLVPAQELASASLAPAFDRLQSLVGPQQQRLATEIEAERGAASAVTRAASFGVAFLVPAIALVVFRSVNQRRRHQAELIATLEREQASSRAKDEMIGSLSHELRTPLTAIYGFALAMEEQGFGDQRFVAETTQLIIGEAGRLSRMVDDLLTAGKMASEGLRFQIEDVEPTREIVEALTPFTRSNRPIEVAAQPALVRADRLRLRHVLTNLVANAVQHGGSSIAVTGKADGGWYHFAVIDDGPGVPADMEDKLFAGYVHEGADTLLAGTVGLGLSVAGTLVERMEGDIRYERRERFSVFHFRLPLSTAPALESVSAG